MPQSKKEVIPLSKQEQYWIALSLFLVVIPHIARLPTWLILFIITVPILKLISNKNAKLLLSFVLTILGVIAVIAEYGRLFGRDAGVALLIIMLFLKLLECKTYRDGFITISMTYFLVITNFFYTQSIATALYMLITVVITTSSLISLNISNEKFHVVDKLKLSGKMVLQALPLMVFLFFLFPRISTPLWGLPADTHTGKSGLSETMAPGTISNLALSDEVAFRVKFNSTKPSTNNLYWRAIIFWHYDGVTWSEGSNAQNEYTSAFDGIDGPSNYTITVEPHNLKWLFALDLPNAQTNVQGAYLIESERVLRSHVKITNIKQYNLSSFSHYRSSHTDLSTSERNRALQLPEDRNPRTVALAKKYTSMGYSTKKIIAETLNKFKQEKFIYSLKPPLYGKDSVDEFLFDSRKGFCEHYASSFTFLMRAAGIPARIVTGYQGGEINPIDDYLIIRQSDAHAWVELWDPHQGWYRIDPTAAASPARIENGLDVAISTEEDPRILLRKRSSLLSSLSLTWDALNHRWNQWVLDYNSQRQEKLMSYFGFEKINPHSLILILTTMLTITTLIITFYILRMRAPKKNDSVYILYQKFCAKFSSLGLSRIEYEGPIDYCHRLKKENVAQYREAKIITKLYVDLRYSGNSNRFKEKEFRKKVNALKVTA